MNSVPPRLDPKLGGRNHNLVAFIRDRDIWVTTSNGCETQLTFCNVHDPDGTAALSCGVAEFVMQVSWKFVSVRTDQMKLRDLLYFSCISIKGRIPPIYGILLGTTFVIKLYEGSTRAYFILANF